MRLTRRGRGLVALIVLLAGIAVLFDRPMVLAGSAVVGAWVLVHQYWFSHLVGEILESITVEQRPSASAIHTGDEMAVALGVHLEAPTSADIAVQSGLPPAAHVNTSLEVSVDSGETDATQTTPVGWPIAGEHRFQKATVTVSDGLFAQTLEVGTPPVVRVEPRKPRNVHVGRGGQQVTASLGEHGGGFLGSTLEIAELREYLPGDAAKLIDWNATARLGSPYVREYESERDRASFLLIDTRSALWEGPLAETKLDYLREVGLEYVLDARQHDDPIGLVTVSESGTETWIQPGATQNTYDRLRRELFELRSAPEEVIAPQGSSPRFTRDGRVHTSEFHLGRAPVATPSVSLESHTETDQAFVESLQPFLGEDHQMHRPLEPTSFVGAIRGVIRQQDRQIRAVLCTDDSHPDDIMAAVREVREAGHQLIVLLTPTVLFEPGTLSDLEAAYERYIAFEEFRRELDRVDGVAAFEVAPGDRLQALLPAEKRQPLRGQSR